MQCLRWFHPQRAPVFRFKTVKPPSAIICARFSQDVSNQSFVLAHQNYEATQLTDSSPTLVVHGMLGSKRNWHTFCKSYNEQTGKQVYGDYVQTVVTLLQTYT